MIKTATKEKINQETGEITEDFLPEKPVEVQKPKLPVIEVDENMPFYKFGLKQITVKEVDKQPQRSISLILLNYISKVFLDYAVFMVCDTAPIENKIEAVQKARLEYEAQQQDLLSDVKKKDLERYDEQERNLRIEMAELIAACPDIKFYTKVQKIDDSGDWLKLDLLVSEETVNELNSAWQQIANYKIQLQHAKV